MTESDLVVPDLEQVPEDDSAEPEDADVSHGASEAQVTAVAEEDA